jgi:hypothetical protein
MHSPEALSCFLLYEFHLFSKAASIVRGVLLIVNRPNGDVDNDDGDIDPHYNGDDDGYNDADDSSDDDHQNDISGNDGDGDNDNDNVSKL